MSLNKSMSRIGALWNFVQNDREQMFIFTKSVDYKSAWVQWVPMVYMKAKIPKLIYQNKNNIFKKIRSTFQILPEMRASRSSEWSMTEIKRIIT